jgi:adenine-specific DNA-methyltransferase
MSIESIKHSDTRVHIPSMEEAGYEDANELVSENQTAQFPLNPVVHRGQTPELYWLNKYGVDNREQWLQVDIRSLYRHEHISPELLINKLYRKEMQQADHGTGSLFSLNEMFGNALEIDEMDKVSEYYRHHDGWTNRLIQGDSLMVMTSLLEREGMAGKVQMIYLDPPYGIKYGSNWQIRLNSRNVDDGKDEHISGEPEQIKAFRDTWELGIHSYLSYMRDRLLVAKELLTPSGSCFVQISDENVHLVRNLMDEVFGSENFIGEITIIKRSPQPDKFLPVVTDYVLWYGKNKELTKYKQLYKEKENKNEKGFTTSDLTSSHFYNSPAFEFQGTTFTPGKRYWSTSIDGLKRLAERDRLVISGKTLRYKRFDTDFPYQLVGNVWNDVAFTSFGDEKLYVVQTSKRAIERCMLMTTDPGDLVLDPTCGSGTTAFVAEQWGRRWITTDTSRIALNIAKTRLMTATFPYYRLYDEQGKDIRQGFLYKKVPHITLKSLANDEPAEEETLYDQPQVDNSRLRVAGAFTVETLQSYEPVAPATLDAHRHDPEDRFEEGVFEQLKSAGIKNGDKQEQAVFVRIDSLSSEHLHAEGFYQTPEGERKAYIHLGPKFGTVSKQAVNQAIKECRSRGDADWLVILGFSFESDIAGQQVTQSMGTFRVDKVRMNDDLMQEGLLKKDKKAASFVTIGEPDIKLSPVASTSSEQQVQVEICGLDIYDPHQRRGKSPERSRHRLLDGRRRLRRLQLHSPAGLLLRGR